MLSTQIIPINKKTQNLILDSGQQLSVVIDTMFSLKVYESDVCVADMVFQPLSSLNNPDLSPTYKITKADFGNEVILEHSDVIRKIAIDFFSTYTNGRILNSIDNHKATNSRMS